MGEKGSRSWAHQGGHLLNRGRKLSSEDLQLVILALLEQQPSHGYELIKSVEEVSDGYYTPSPGMVYPALTFLEEIGWADVEVIGTKKRYRLTAEGIAALEADRSRAEWILSEFKSIGQRMDDARKAFAGEFDPEAGLARQSEAMHEARHQLRNLLRSYEPLDEEDDQRVVKIIATAVGRIKREIPLAATPAELLKTVRSRRSVGVGRQKPDSVDRAIIEQMLEAANWAPSHGRTEPWRFTVFMGSGRDKLVEILGQLDEPLESVQQRIYSSPVWIAIVVCPKLNDDGQPKMPFEEEELAVACAVQNLHLAATSFGLVGKWTTKGTMVHHETARALGYEPPSKLIGFFCCGYPAGAWPEGARQPIYDKVTWIEQG